MRTRRAQSSSVARVVHAAHRGTRAPRYPALRDRLVEAHPEEFADDDAGVRVTFFALAERMSLRNQLRMTQAFRPLSERYAYLDPDEVEGAAGPRDIAGAGLSRCVLWRGGACIAIGWGTWINI